MICLYSSALLVSHHQIRVRHNQVGYQRTSTYGIYVYSILMLMRWRDEPSAHAINDMVDPL
jgi:hypothetical protein